MLLKKLMRTAVVLLALASLAGGASWALRPAGGAALHAQTPEIQEKVNTRLDYQRLQGTWRPVAVLSLEEGAEDKNFLKRARLVIKGKRFRVTTTVDLEMPVKRHLNVVLMEGRVEIDPNKTPKTMDWVVDNTPLERPILKVYEVEGDRLKIVTGLANRRPPALKPDPEGSKTTFYERVVGTVAPTDGKRPDDSEAQSRSRTAPPIPRNIRSPEGEKKAPGGRP